MTYCYTIKKSAFLFSALFLWFASFHQAEAQLAFSSCTVTQSNTTVVQKGTLKAEIIRIEIVITGSGGTISVGNFSLSVKNAPTAAADVSSCSNKLYLLYGGTNPVFSTSYPVRAVCSGTCFSLPYSWNAGGSTMLSAAGTYYFWLVYDVSASATTANYLDGACWTVYVGGVLRVPQVTDPSGNRRIEGNQSFSSVVTELGSAAALATGSADNEIIKIKINMIGGLNPMNATNFTCSTIGTTINTDSADICNAKIFYTTSNTFNPSTPFGNVVASPNGSFTITGTQPLVHGANYFWLTYDIPSGATDGNRVDASCTSVIVGGTSYNIAFPAPGKGRFIGTNGALQITWDKRFGGSNISHPFALVQIGSDYYIGGCSNVAAGSGQKTAIKLGWYDFWLVKTDENGTKLWDKTYGGDTSDFLRAIVKTGSDLLLIGNSQSDVSGNKTAGNFGGEDFWIVKIDANGNMLWDKSYGGDYDDIPNAAILTSDGGLLITGYTLSDVSGNKSSPNQFPGGGFIDVWIIKTDAAGNKQWEADFGGNTGYDSGISLVQTADGYYVAAQSNSPASGNKTTGNQGNYDYWLLKLDWDGNKLWEANFGSSAEDRLYAIAASPDGGCLLGGHTSGGISGDKSEASKGGQDYWIVKVSPTGSKVWDRTIGGMGSEFFSDMIHTSAGGYLLMGTSDSGVGADKTVTYWDGNINSDVWLVKIDENGTKLLDRTYGGYTLTGEESVYASGNASGMAGKIIETNSFLIAITSGSGRSGEKTEDANLGQNDFWVFHLNGESEIATPVDWISVDAEYKDKYVEISWSTAQQMNVKQFQVQRSRDGKNFETIGSIIPSVQSVPVHDYSYPDWHPVQGYNWYRIMQIDYDGNVNLSPVVEVLVGFVPGFSVGLPFPNPAMEDVNVRLVSDYPEFRADIEVTDATGRKISVKKSIQIERGVMDYRLDLSNFSSGTYFMNIHTPDGTEVRKFLVQ